MPDDPNKKMDELLKAYAQERRKAPEPNLHPATRKMLQGEVSRVLGSANPQRSWLHRFRTFWPQIAFGTSLCLILGIAVFSLRQPPPSPAQQKLSDEKALGEKNVKAAEDASLAVLPAPEQDTPVLLKKKDELERQESEELRQVELRLLKREQPQPVPQAPEPVKERFVLQEAQEAQKAQVQAPAPTTLQRDSASSGGIGGGARSKPMPSQAQSTRVETLQDQFGAKPATATEFYTVDKAAASPPTPVDSEARSRAASSPSQLAPTASSGAPSVSGPSANAVAGLPPANVANRGLQISTAEKLARANEMTNLGAARRLQFVQLTSAPAPTLSTVAAPTALFTSFQMEQLGKDIRFLENDGSVYFGIIDQATNLTGQVVAGTTLAERRLDERLYEQKASSTAATNPPAFSFTAQGTNLTLGKSIVLTGQYFERTNAGPSALDSLSVYKKTQATGRGAQRPEPQHMIIGTAVIGATNQIPLRAVSRE